MKSRFNFLNSIVPCELFLDIWNHIGLYEPYADIESDIRNHMSTQEITLCHRLWIYIDIWNFILHYELIYRHMKPIRAIWTIIVIRKRNDYGTMSRGKEWIKNPLEFLPNVPFLYPLKTSENLCFPDFFRGFRSWTLG